MLSCNCIDCQSENGHHFEALQLRADTNWLELISREYVTLRSKPRTDNTPISIDGIGVIDTSFVQQKLKEKCLPTYRGGNFDVVRSDFGEIIALMILENSYKTEFGYKSVRDRELRDLSGRGIDAIGIEGDETLTLVLAEVKVSDEEDRKPQVVDDSKDSLSKQLKGHIEEYEATSDKIWDLVRREQDSALYAKLVKAAMYWDEKLWDKLKIICSAFLIRPERCYASRDFGNLRANPEQVSPAFVRFFIVCFPGELCDILPELCNLAISGEQQ